MNDNTDITRLRLLVGGDSFICRELCHHWHLANISFHSTTRRLDNISETRPYLDLKYPSWNLDFSNYDVAVVCAGITNISTCEVDVESVVVNTTNTVALAKYLSKYGIYVLFLSSDKVFDESVRFHDRQPTDLTCPNTEYGRQKVDAERLICQLPNSAVLRLSKVVDLSSDLFLDWQQKLSRGEKIYAYSDVYLSPILITTVVTTITEMVSAKTLGYNHISTPKEMTYAEYATTLAKDWALDPGLVVPISSDTHFDKVLNTPSTVR